MDVVSFPIIQDPRTTTLPNTQSLDATAFSSDPLDLGGEFLCWGIRHPSIVRRARVNPFDQPDVEEAKRLARAETEWWSGAACRAPAHADAGAAQKAVSAGGLRRHSRLRPAHAGDRRAAAGPARRLGEKLGCATTLGIGPRYLHSTGQLHKGGPNTGLFLVITTEIGEDLEIPSMGWTFGELHHAQARGDIRALLARRPGAWPTCTSPALRSCRS